MAAAFAFGACCITFRVAEPEVLARHLRFSANGVTARGLGGRNEVTGAGNPVLCDVPPHRDCHNGKHGETSPLLNRIHLRLF